MFPSEERPRRRGRQSQLGAPAQGGLVISHLGERALSVPVGSVTALEVSSLGSSPDRLFLAAGQ